MKTVTQVKIEPQNADQILGLIRQFNSACSYLSEVAFTEKLWHWHHLQKRAYHEIKGRLGLSAAQAHVAIRKATYACRNKARRKSKARFKPLGAVLFFKHVEGWP